MNYCDNCGNEFPSKKRKQRYCGQSCATKHQHQLRKVSQRCKYCSKYASSENGYCNESCAEKHAWLKNRRCLCCGNKIPEEKKQNKFCGLSCSASYTNRQKPRRAKRRPCAHCGKLTNNPVAVYCSNRCQADYQWVQRIAEFDTAKEVTSKTSHLAKKYLKQKRGVRCEICKDAEHNFGGKVVPMPLVLDHIDGNSDNWKLSNLRLVCGRCDMLLPTYKAKNRGNGRHYRRKRYAQGKSY